MFVIIAEILWPEQYNRTVIFSILTKNQAHVMISSYHIQMFRFSAENNNISWCNGKSLTFQKPPGQIISLISYPKSGNTWLRHLIQQSTGLLTDHFMIARFCKGMVFQENQSTMDQ